MRRRPRGYLPLLPSLHFRPSKRGRHLNRGARSRLEDVQEDSAGTSLEVQHQGTTPASEEVHRDLRGLGDP